MRYCLIGLLAFVIIDIGYLASIWPDWDDYRKGPIQKSSFIKQYQLLRDRRGWP
ncbi:MAG: hypothetical protein GY806_14300, partial [Gammaproteobacteria bacterium]|nr:hypothetical protein [Gammaproteobacteria bacterium]